MWRQLGNAASSLPFSFHVPDSYDPSRIYSRPFFPLLTFSFLSEKKERDTFTHESEDASLFRSILVSVHTFRPLLSHILFSAISHLRPLFLLTPNLRSFLPPPSLSGLFFLPMRVLEEVFSGSIHQVRPVARSREKRAPLEPR